MMTLSVLQMTKALLTFFILTVDEVNMCNLKVVKLKDPLLQHQTPHRQSYKPAVIKISLSGVN